MKLHIIAAIVDTKELTLYLKDGSQKKIPQGDKRLAIILEEITPQLVKNKEAFYEEKEEEATGEYVEFEGRTNGVVKFFKIAKAKLAEFLANMDEKPAPTVEATAIGDDAVTAKYRSIVGEIISHAEPIKTDALSEQESVVAVVGSNVIPDSQALLGQVINSNETNSIGLENFMKRVAPVAEKRMHSVSDLMKFMEKGDLPIAEDGSIIIYKVLKKKAKDGHTYVDCHTQNVPQSVGTYVCMDESLVDHDRRNECSNGLHVARRGYIKSFSGDVCVLAKVAPEDVIAVPLYDANKMRVAGYHILFELPPEAYSKLRNDVPMTDNPTARVLLNKALIGDHVGKLCEVRIGGHKGTNIKQQALMAEKAAEASLSSNIITSIDKEATAIKEVTPKGVISKEAVVSVKEAIKVKEAVKDTIANLPTRLEKAKVLFDAYQQKPNEETWNDLIAFKTKCKCSWATLGLPDLTQKKETKHVAKTTQPAKPLTRNEKAAQLLKCVKNSTGTSKKAYAEELVEYKRKCKIGFDALGLSKKDVELLMRLTKK